MRRTTFILDSDPDTKLLWISWEARKASIHKNILKLDWPHGIMEIEADDPQLVADMLFTHDSKAEICKGKLGITKVSYTENPIEDDLSNRIKSLIRDVMKADDL